MHRLGISLATLSLIALSLFACMQAHPAEGQSCCATTVAASGAVRIGTFDRTQVLVAYYKSEVSDRHLRDLTAQRDAARAGGDDAEVKRLEAQGSALQDVAHEQLEGKAELTNVIEALRPGLAQVAAATGVSVIVEKPLWSAKDVDLVDVTRELAATLPEAARYSRGK